MDFEPWIRDQLAHGLEEAPDAVPAPSRRPRGRGWPAFRVGFAGLALLVTATGLASGRALPVLQLTTPHPQAHDLPVSTWAGRPTPPPGTVQLSAGHQASPSGLDPSRSSTPAPRPSGEPPAGQPQPTARPAGDGSHPTGSGPGPVPAPAASPSTDSGGGRSPGGPSSPRPTASPSPRDGGGHDGMATPEDAGSHSGGDRSPSPTPGY